MFLGQVVTDLELAPDAPLAKTCGNCVRCIDDCPTGAIVAPYVIDNRKCISFLTIELRGPIPRELRPLVGAWVFGCDICQDVCPVNRKARLGGEVAFRQRGDFAAPELIPLLELDEQGFRERFRGSPMKRAKLSGLRRNACVALGNLGDPAAVPALAIALAGDDALVRSHAAWALGRIGGAAAQSALRAAQSGRAGRGRGARDSARPRGCGVPRRRSAIVRAGFKPALSDSLIASLTPRESIILKLPKEQRLSVGTIASDVAAFTRPVTGSVRAQFSMTRRSIEELRAIVVMPIHALIFMAVFNYVGRQDLAAYSLVAPMLMSVGQMGFFMASELLARERYGQTLELVVAAPLPSLADHSLEDHRNDSALAVGDRSELADYSARIRSDCDGPTSTDIRSHFDGHHAGGGGHDFDHGSTLQHRQERTNLPELDPLPFVSAWGDSGAHHSVS